jgi:ABC-type phosphate transport system substrate-binding protein
MNNFTVAAAVAVALGAASAAHADSCAAPTYALYVAGSSAAKPAFQVALANDLFTAETSFSSSNGDFEAFCGPISATGATNTGLTAGLTATVYYRAEGGSVVGALPVVSGKAVNFLDLSGTGCNVATPATTGTSAVNGTTDSWGGCVTTHGVELGVTDLEPSVFLASAGNYPTAYSPTVFGTASPAQLVSLAATSIPLFQQVFGIFVNTVGINGGTTKLATLNLSKETVAQILTGHYKNWNKVPSDSGGAISSTSQTIAIENREAGSGTRTGASLYFLGQECTGSNAIALKDGAASLDSYATGDVLKAANGVSGSITYASIDNDGKQPNLTLVSLSGVLPSNLAAAEGQYDYWFEATAVNGNTTGTSGGITTNGGAAISGFLTGGELQNLATAPHAADINVIPTAGTNSATVPLTSSTVGTKTIYVNPFTRGGNSCTIPIEEN